MSVDYLSRPLEVFKEMHRVLKPVSDSSSCFSRFTTFGTRACELQCLNFLLTFLQGGLAIMSFSNRSAYPSSCAPDPHDAYPDKQRHCFLL